MTITLDELYTKQEPYYRYESLSISCSDILNNFKSKELRVTSDYLQTFRWTTEQQSLFIESIFLRIPIPHICIASYPDGFWDLLDGLQRVLTIIRFFGDDEVGGVYPELFKEEKNLTLCNCRCIPELNDKTIKDLTVQNRLLFKRSHIPVIFFKGDAEDSFSLYQRLHATDR
jgi:uncharacterized protein with ParB-like and HNH nuclease domain